MQPHQRCEAEPCHGPVVERASKWSSCPIATIKPSILHPPAGWRSLPTWLASNSSAQHQFKTLQVAQLAQTALNQVLSAFPWLLWHAPLSCRLAAVWETESARTDTHKRGDILASTALRQVRKPD